MSRTTLILPGGSQSRREDLQPTLKRSHDDVEDARKTRRPSASRHSAPSIRIAGGGIPSFERDFHPSPPARPLRRSLTQPPISFRASQAQKTAPSWSTAPEPPFQVVQTSSQAPQTRKTGSRLPLEQSQKPHQVQAQLPPRHDFTKFAYSGPSDPFQAPTGKRLTLPPAVSRSTSARPSYTPQGAEYRTTPRSSHSQTPSQLEAGLSQIVETSRAKVAAQIDAEPSKPKKRRKKQNEGPKKIDLSVPEEGSWIRGNWVPTTSSTESPPSQDGEHPQADSQRADVVASENPNPVLPKPSPAHPTGNSSFGFDRSLEATGRPESQLPPGRQPRRDTSISNPKQYISSQPVPSYTTPQALSSISTNKGQPLFLPLDSDEERGTQRKRQRQSSQGEAQASQPPIRSQVHSSRGSEVAPDMGHAASRPSTPPAPPPRKTTRSSRSEKTYSTRLPVAYTYRAPGTNEGVNAHALDDGLSFNQDLIRKRRRTTVDPSQVSHRPARDVSVDPFAAPIQQQATRRHAQEASVSNIQETHGNRYHDGYEVEGEEELDDFADNEPDESGFTPLDVYEDNTPSPTPAQRQQVLPEHQHEVDHLFDAQHQYPKASFDPATMRPLTERLVLDPNHRYVPVPTQSPPLSHHRHHRRHSKSGKHGERHRRRKHSPRHYHDRDYPSERRHRRRHSHSHSHWHQYDEPSTESDDPSPNPRLRMSRNQSAGPRIDKYVENTLRHHSEPTPTRRPLIQSHRPHNLIHRKPDTKTRAAQRVSKQTKMIPIDSVTGDEARKLMLERSQLESHPIDKHLLGATSKDRQRARLEALTGVKRKPRKEKENTTPRSAPARYTLPRPSDVAGGNHDLVQATQSTIEQFPAQTPAAEVRRATLPRPHRLKFPQLKFTRRTSPESPPRAAPHVIDHQPDTPNGHTNDQGQSVSHTTSQQTPTPIRPATPLDTIIPPLPRVPIGVRTQPFKDIETPQRPVNVSTTPSSVKSARDQARARRDAADKAMVDAMLTPAEAERLAREISPNGRGLEEETFAAPACAGEQPVSGQETANPAQGRATTLSGGGLRHSASNTSSQVPKTTNHPDPSRQIGKTMTREAISDTGQEMRELLKKLKSNSSPSKSSGSGPSGSKGKERSRRRKHTGTPTGSGQSDPKQAKLPSFMDRILPDGPPVPTQAEVRSTQVLKKTTEGEFEVKLKEPEQLLLSDLPMSGKKRLGKHRFEDLPGSTSGSQIDRSQGGLQRGKKGSGRLGLGLPNRQNTQSVVNSLGSGFGKTQFSQAVTRPYKNPTTANTPRMVQEDRERGRITPTQRSGPSQAQGYEENEDEDELVDDDDDDYGRSTAFGHALRKSSTSALQQSLAEATVGIRKTNPGARSGFIAPKAVRRTQITSSHMTQRNSLGLSGVRDVLTEDSNDIEMITDEEEEEEEEEVEEVEEEYGSGYDETQFSTGLDHHLGLVGTSTGKQSRIRSQA